MANPEHLAILRQGVEAWNKWREENPEVKPELIGASLINMNLSGANLVDVNFYGANLGRAILKGANIRRGYLSRAYLEWADLQEADLQGAIIEEANLNSANLVAASLNGANLKAVSLRWANLSKADLVGAYLFMADIGGANLSGAKIGNTTIGYTLINDIDLSLIHGLEEVKHDGPSSIGIDTIFRSSGKIPESFLRGAGVPEEFIKMIPELLKTQIAYPACFISYSSKDEEFARRLHADLQAANVRCWFAPHDMRIGDDILDRIDETIRSRDKLLLILSGSSIQSDWVELEVKKAMAEERRRQKGVLFPVRLDDAVMDTAEPWACQLKDNRHIGDFTRWKDHDAYKKAFDRLLRDLKASAQTAG